MTYTGFSNIANNVGYQYWLGQLGTTKIPETLSLFLELPSQCKKMERNSKMVYYANLLKMYLRLQPLDLF